MKWVHWKYNTVFLSLWYLNLQVSLPGERKAIFTLWKRDKKTLGQGKGRGGTTKVVFLKIAPWFLTGNNSQHLPQEFFQKKKIGFWIFIPHTNTDLQLPLWIKSTLFPVWGWTVSSLGWGEEGLTSLTLSEPDTESLFQKPVLENSLLWFCDLWQGYNAVLTRPFIRFAMMKFRGTGFHRWDIPTTARAATMWNPVGSRPHLELVAKLGFGESSYGVFVHYCSWVPLEKGWKCKFCCARTPSLCLQIFQTQTIISSLTFALTAS